MMRSISRIAVAGCMALAALGSVAVLGVGSRTAQADPSLSPFAGSWSGNWAHVEDDVVGTWDWTISDAGRISGTVVSITNDWGGTVVGHVGADGRIKFRGAPNSPEEDPGSFPHQGTAEIDGDGKLVVSATGTWSGALSLVGTLERN